LVFGWRFSVCFEFDKVEQLAIKRTLKIPRIRQGGIAYKININIEIYLIESESMETNRKDERNHLESKRKTMIKNERAIKARRTSWTIIILRRFDG
jgi:hypothetical protein